MALFFSALSDGSGEDQPHFSLSTDAHIKTHRLWMFALVKDQPNAFERDHIAHCDSCGRAFRSALGISAFSEGMKDAPYSDTSNPSVPQKEKQRAVA